MNAKISAASSLLVVASLAAAGPQGTVPRVTADRYAAHGETQGTSVGAALLTAKEVRTKFISDVNQCCLVIEVGFYPAKDKAQVIASHDFSMRVGESDIWVKPTSPNETVASILNSAGSRRGTPVTPSVGVGYGTGSATGGSGRERTHSVYTQGSSGVGVADPTARPAPSEADRKAMVGELTEKGLPEGTVSTPIAGYLYFPLAKQKKASIELEYLLNSNRMVLKLP